MDEEQGKAVANQAATMLYGMIAGMPNNIQMEAALVLVRTLFITTVKKEKCLSLFNMVVQQMRGELKDYLKKKGTEK